ALRPASGAVSVVYSETFASASSSGAAPAPSSSSWVLVGSATVPSSRSVIGSSQASLSLLPVCPAALLGGRGLCPGRLCDLGDGKGDRLLRLVRVVRPGVHLQLAQHVPAQRVLGQHALDGVLHQPLGALGEQLAIGDRADAARVARVPVGPLVGE